MYTVHKDCYGTDKSPALIIFIKHGWIFRHNAFFTYKISGVLKSDMLYIDIYIAHVTF